MSSQPRTFAIRFWYYKWEENDRSPTTVILERIPPGTTSDEEKKLWTFSESWVYLNVADKIHTTKRFETYYISSRKSKRVLIKLILPNSNNIKPVD